MINVVVIGLIAAYDVLVWGTLFLVLWLGGPGYRHRDTADLHPWPSSVHRPETRKHVDAG